ncbi:MAG TPA: hypothetical protein VK144_08430 [Bacillota bacterium]|nr:hypothetical protein [Bacillota bacterium]
MHILLIESQTKKPIPQAMEQCTINQRLDEHVRISAFIEEITTHPMMIHISEPMDVSMEVHISEGKKKSLQGSWITWFVFKDSPSCFLRDNVTTDVMDKKSKALHEQLQEKMMERN